MGHRKAYRAITAIVGRPASLIPFAAMITATLVSACTTEQLFSPRPSLDITASVPAARPAAPSVPPITRTVGYVPRISLPQADDTIMPASERECRARLTRAGAQWRDLPPVEGNGACGIAWPVELTGTGGGTSIEPAATLSCSMALTFTRWTRNELAPAARLRYLSGVGTIRQGSSYSCRTIGGRPGGRLSAHATGDALDIMAIELKNGRTIDVRKPGFFSFRQRGFLNSVRADACPYFTTVLGPGYDRDHRDHFHFDLMRRRSGHRACK